MGNACIESSYNIERLQQAVIDNDPSEVRFCLDGGVNVNESIDDHDFKVYDLFEVVRQQRLKNSAKESGGNEQMFGKEEDDRSEQIRDMLIKAGAMKRGLKKPGVKPQSNKTILRDGFRGSKMYGSSMQSPMSMAADTMSPPESPQQFRSPSFVSNMPPPAPPGQREPAIGYQPEGGAPQNQPDVLSFYSNAQPPFAEPSRPLYPDMGLENQMRPASFYSSQPARQYSGQPAPLYSATGLPTVPPPVYRFS